MGDPDPAAAAAAAVQAVSLKLPTFLASRPDVWFQQTEAQFALRHITDSTTQYYYLLTALDPVVAERMAGDVALTPGDDKYAYLKQKLMEVYGLTDDQKADRLLDLSGIGDWKPSQLCAHIQSLTVGQDVLLRRIFLRQLPEDVRVQHSTWEAYLSWHVRLMSSWQQNVPLCRFMRPHSSRRRRSLHHVSRRNLPFVGTIRSLVTRLRPVDHLVLTHPHRHLRETSGPAPSGAGYWP